MLFIFTSILIFFYAHFPLCFRILSGITLILERDCCTTVSFCLAENMFILPSILMAILAVYLILSSQYCPPPPAPYRCYFLFF